jgi:hypothetical protein
MSAIYVVMGMTGEWGSDRIEWPVRAFTVEERAQDLVTKASDRARELRQWLDGYDQPWRYANEETRPKNKYDPNMRMDYTGTSYFYMTVELEP